MSDHTPEQLALANEIARLAEQRNAVFFGAVITAITKSAMQTRITELEKQIEGNAGVDSVARKQVEKLRIKVDEIIPTLTVQVKRLEALKVKLDNRCAELWDYSKTVEAQVERLRDELNKADRILAKTVRLVKYYGYEEELPELRIEERSATLAETGKES